MFRKGWIWLKTGLSHYALKVVVFLGIYVDLEEPADVVVDIQRDVLGTICDKHGDVYDVTAAGDRFCYQVSIHQLGHDVGYVNLCWREPPVMELADLNISPTYRNRGVGTALMPLLYDVARRNHLTSVHGFVVHQDVQETPYLLIWYKRCGFRVEVLPHNEHVVARIARPTG